MQGRATFPGGSATALRTLREKLDAETKELEKLKAEEADEKRTNDMIIPAYRQFKTWSVEFEESSFEAKKMIAGQLFRRIEVRKDYEITYELNLTYAKFCEEWLESTKRSLPPSNRWQNFMRRRISKYSQSIAIHGAVWYNYI